MNSNSWYKYQDTSEGRYLSMADHDESAMVSNNYDIDGRGHYYEWVWSYFLSSSENFDINKFPWVWSYGISCP